VGFWDVMKKVGKGALKGGGIAAAPFTGGASAWLPAVIGAGAGIGSSLLANRGGAGRGSLPEASLSPQETGLVESQAELVDDLTETYKRFFGVANPSLEAVMKFWMPILSGDQTAVGNLLAPEIGMISKQFETARRDIGSFVPRGGGKSAALGRTNLDQAGAVANLIGTARPRAAAALTELGGAAGQLGLGAAGEAGRGISDTLFALINRRGQDIEANLTRRGQNIGLAGEAGRGIGGIIAALLAGRNSGTSRPRPYPGDPNYPGATA
jgi:hypothetical protein